METPMKVGEADRSSPRDIQQLKQWLSTRPHLPSVPENMLHVFHHSCYFDLTKTKDCIDTYYTLRSSCTDIFKDRNLADKDLKAACQNTLNILIPKRSPEDYQIIFQRVESTDCSKYNFEQTCKIFFMGLDSVIHNEGIVPGYMILLDYKNVRLGHLAKTSISSMRKMFRYIQEGSPIRLKSIHMINMNYFIEKVMAFVKPFMHKDLYNLIHFYPEGQMEKLLQYIPYECLPEEYGGKLAPCKVLYDQYLQILEKNHNYFKCENNAFPVQERLRPSNKKNKKKNDEPSEISLKSLEID